VSDDGDGFTDGLPPTSDIPTSTPTATYSEPTYDAEGNLIYPYEPGVSIKGRAVQPRTLEEANALLDDPNFKNPSGPWPAFAWVDVDEGPIRWDDVAQKFMMAWEYAPEAPMPDRLDITFKIFGPLKIPATLEILKTHPYVGDRRLDGEFQKGQYVSLPGPPPSIAYYNSRIWKEGTAPPAAPGTETPRPQQSPGYYLNPAYDPNNPTPHPGGPHITPAYVPAAEVIPQVPQNADKIIADIEARLAPPEE